MLGEMTAPDADRGYAVSEETKRRIVDASRKLFSRSGYEGVSVRQIAEASATNVAAINYHFKNKENLYWEIVGQGFDEADRICQDHAERAGGIEAFGLGVFDSFLQRPDLTLNTMKLILSEDLEPPEGTQFFKKMQKELGPPGGIYFQRFLAKATGRRVDSEIVRWATKSIFGAIVHWTMMLSTSHMKAMGRRQKEFRADQIREDVRRIILATVQFTQSR